MLFEIERADLADRGNAVPLVFVVRRIDTAVKLELYAGFVDEPFYLIRHLLAIVIATRIPKWR